jgi:hypothetical protein
MRPRASNSKVTTRVRQLLRKNRRSSAAERHWTLGVARRERQTGWVDQRSVLVKPATLDVSFGDVVSMSALLPTANMTPWSTCGGNRETRISAFV